MIQQKFYKFETDTILKLKKMNIDECKELLDFFLVRWTTENILNMTLEEYVGLGNQDTFCQWVETKTRMLGSIKGMTSIKFGIYERKNPDKTPTNYKNDDKYSWLRGYGDSRKTAFENIKSDIINIMKLSEAGKFEQIDHILLPDLFKWKVAFLYSNERLIPIFKRDVLLRIAEHFGHETDRNTKVSDIQSVMMLSKPAYLDVYTFMRKLYDQFGNEDDKIEIAGRIIRIKPIRTKRKGAGSRNIEAQIRSGGNSYVAQQKHNKIQEALVKLLSDTYGKENVLLEENFVDVKLIQPEYVSFYEVKSSSYASECVKEALGQILLYSMRDADTRPRKHFVVGQYPATDNEKKYIEFLKSSLNLEFDYINVELDSEPL